MSAVIWLVVGIVEVVLVSTVVICDVNDSYVASVDVGVGDDDVVLCCAAIELPAAVVVAAEVVSHSSLSAMQIYSYACSVVSMIACDAVVATVVVKDDDVGVSVIGVCDTLSTDVVVVFA
jgi:hypothetical protein